jgi:hypothetical protein
VRRTIVNLREVKSRGRICTQQLYRRRAEEEREETAPMDWGSDTFVL